MKNVYFIFIAVLFAFAASNCAAQTNLKVETVLQSSYCKCSAFTVSYSSGTNTSYSVGNVFTAELSDVAGSFSNPVFLGSLTGNSKTGTINCNLPCNIIGGLYRVRIRSNSPSYTSWNTGSVYVQDSSNAEDWVQLNARDTSFCPGSGNIVSFNISAAPGTTNLSYQWKVNGANVGSTSIEYSTPSLKDGDAVSCEVTFSNECINNITVTKGPYYPRSSKPILKDSVKHTVCGLNQGYVGVIATAANPNSGYFTFKWSNGGTNLPFIKNVEAGTYIVTVTGYYGLCTTVDTLVVLGLDAFSLTEEHTNTSCGNSDGTIQVYKSQGGTAPYTYLWSNGATGSSITGLGQGIYTVTATDAKGCTVSKSATINNANGPAVTATANSASCSNSNGAIIVSVAGGTQPYNYNWSNGVTTRDLNAVAPGQYTITVTDDGGCEGYATATVGNDNLLSIQSTTVRQGCGNHGSFFVRAFGGTQLYTYKWNNGATTGALENVPSGLYSVVVTEASGCSISKALKGEFKFYAYLEAQNEGCGGSGIVEATVFGGVPPYTYAWSNGQTGAKAVGLANGYYTITVTDSLGCTATAGKQVYYFFKCKALIKGRIFEDKNNNCVFDGNDVPIKDARINAFSGSWNYHGITNADGFYTVEVPGDGNYKVKSFLNGGSNSCGSLSLCNAAERNITVGAAPDTISDINFGYVMLSGTYDLEVHPGWSEAKPGFEKEYWIYVYNKSTVPYNGGPVTVVFAYDENLEFISSGISTPVHDAAAHTLTWEFDHVPGMGDDMRCRFNVSPSVSVNYKLQSHFSVSPTDDDCNVANNYLSVEDEVKSSRDPNEKEVSPAGYILPTDSVLTYTINFQNTGNDTTDFVIITDTLSSYLDAISVQNIASSHAYEEFNISGEGILKWVFNPIYLVDSATNESGSKGFVMFNVKRKKDMPILAVITNKASIFFDYNDPVITNTVSSALSTVISEVEGSNTLKVYPNPATDFVYVELMQPSANTVISVTDVLGKILIQKVTGTQENSIDISKLSAGVYFVKAGGANASGVVKVVKE